MSKQNVTIARRRPKQVEEASVRCCAAPDGAALSAEQSAELAPMFKAVGDPVRLRLLSLIASSAEVCVCELTDAFALSGPTISHHLKVLREAGLVDGERRGTWVYYRIRPEVLRSMAALLGGAPTHVPARTASESLERQR